MSIIIKSKSKKKIKVRRQVTGSITFRTGSVFKFHLVGMPCIEGGLR